MNERKQIDFTKVYGDVPLSFSHRVEYALRRTHDPKEVHQMKRKPMIAILIVVLMLALTTTAVAAVLSGTIEFFGKEYGPDFKAQLEQGKVAPGGQTTEFNGVTVTMTDFVVVPDQANWLAEQGELEQPVDTLSFYATGTLTPAKDEKLVLMPWDDYTIDHPYGYEMLYPGYPKAPEGAPTYAEVAKEKGATIRRVNCIANGILDENGELLSNTIGSCLIVQEDGSILFSVEIPSEHVIPEQDSYQMSIYIGMQDVDADGNLIEGTYQGTDWVVTLVPEKAE